VTLWGLGWLVKRSRLSGSSVFSLWEGSEEIVYIKWRRAGWNWSSVIGLFDGANVMLAKSDGRVIGNERVSRNETSEHDDENILYSQFRSVLLKNGCHYQRNLPSLPLL
jgi:hypothetical protein